MAKVDFYILEQTSGLKSLHYACGLVEKAYSEQKPVYIHTNSREEAERMDTLLWTYRDDSFLPHGIYDAADDCSAFMQIGFEDIAFESWRSFVAKNAPQDDSHKTPVLVNLSNGIPQFYQKCSNIIEIVFSDPVVQQLARERFKQYRDQGCEMNTYKIKASEL